MSGKREIHPRELRKLPHRPKLAEISHGVPTFWSTDNRDLGVG